LSGTHSATTADLGTNAPTTAVEVVGHTLTIDAHDFSRVITAYNESTGVATFASTAVTLANGNAWVLVATPASTVPPTAAANATAVRSELTTELDEIGSILADTADMQPKLGTMPNLGGGANLGQAVRDLAGATFDTSTDSNEAIRNHDATIKSETALIVEDTGTTIPGTITTLQTSVDDVPTVAEFEARTLPAGSYFDAVTDTVRQASYTNADGDECTFVISEMEPHITVDCTEAP
jgi:hypothetical protein